MKSLTKAIQSRNDFEDFIYERAEGTSLYLNGKSISFIGGFFVFEETNPIHDIDGFEIDTTIEKKYCTIEKVRRELLAKETAGENIDLLDQYDENKMIAHIVLLYGA